jgi:hypothetical protein
MCGRLQAGLGQFLLKILQQGSESSSSRNYFVLGSSGIFKRVVKVRSTLEGSWSDYWCMVAVLAFQSRWDSASARGGSSWRHGHIYKCWRNSELRYLSTFWTGTAEVRNLTDQWNLNRNLYSYLIFLISRSNTAASSPRNIFPDGKIWKDF